MPARTKGYHYAYRANGTKYRVYSSGGKRKATGRRSKGYTHGRRGGGYRVGYDGDVVMGLGAYRKGGIRRTGGRVAMGSQAPRVMNSNGRFIITHEEYLGDLNSSQAFVNTGFALNPGLTLAEGGFTNWLPNVAQQFEQWKALGIVFMFKSTSSDAVLSTAANSALGTVSMATDYNALNAAFASKVQMENYEHSVSTKPSNNLKHYVECSPRQTPVRELYVRTGAVPSGADQRLYDLGLFQIASSGQQVSGGAMGEVWVSYTIELLKPRILPGNNQVGEDAVFDHYNILPAFTAGAAFNGTSKLFTDQTTGLIFPSTQSTLGGVVSGGVVTAANCTPSPTTPTKNNFLGGVAVLDANGNPTGALGSSVASTFYFPPGVSAGSFMLQYNIQGTAGASGTIAATLTNCSLLALMKTDTVSSYINDGTTPTTVNYTLFVTVTKPYANIKLAGTTLAITTPVAMDLFVSQIPTPIN